MSDVLPPPPPPRGDGGGCWKWGAISCAIGCGVLVILVVVVIFLGRNFFGRAIKLGTDAAASRMEMETVYRAVEKYNSDNGKYPDRLDQLVPKYVASQQGLRLSTQPAGPEYTYYKPTKDSAPNAILLEYKLEMQVPDGSSVQMPVMILKNGEYVQGSGQARRPMPGGRIPSPAGGG